MAAPPSRKHPRLPGHDYGETGVYFVTTCTKDHKRILSEIVGRADPGAPEVRLTEIGRIVEYYTKGIALHYPNIAVDHFVIMPNHVHLLLSIGSGAPGSARPTIPRIIGGWKRFTNQACNRQLWQTSFHDHVIRDEEDYLKHWLYIDGNPAKWAEDKYYYTAEPGTPSGMGSLPT